MHFENIKIGSHIIITYDDLLEQQSSFQMMHRPAHYDGTPLKVVSKNCPFILVEYQGHTFSIDTRRFNFTICSNRSYIKNFKKNIFLNQNVQGDIQTETKNIETLSFEIAHPCPRCQGPMIERLVIGETRSELVCEECGFKGDL